MSFLTGGNSSPGAEEAKAANRTATQRQNESAARSQQTGERSGGGKRKDRSLFLGNLSALLKKTLGG